MEHLDLAGMITNLSNWGIPAFDQQDAIYLSSSRQMLEPILEETSEDEENNQNSWSQCEKNSAWSSESETGSVIRIELNKDPDSISERDFACPAKRARRDEFLIGGPTQVQPVLQPVGATATGHSSLDDTVLLRKPQRTDLLNDNSTLDRFIAFETNFTSQNSRDNIGTQAGGSQHRSSGGSKRFDEFYSDSDSLSYHSLSRSSSLIQFESLERQMLNEQYSSMSSSMGNSSPSLLSFEGGCIADGSSNACGGSGGSGSGNNSRRGSQSSLLKRYESSDGRLHQTYYDLDKIVFEDNLLFKTGSPSAVETTVQSSSSKSDSECSTSSSSDNSILSKPSGEDPTDSGGIPRINATSTSATEMATTSARVSAFHRGGKSSAENLSEDSGYCEHIHSSVALMRAKSKSIPKNFEKFCEEDEFFFDHGGCSSEEQQDFSCAATKSIICQHQHHHHVHAAVTTAIDDENKTKYSKICLDDDDDEKFDFDPKIESTTTSSSLLDLTFVVQPKATMRTTTPVRRWHRNSDDKNSLRSLSSSPVSEDASSSAASCASATSFTWMQSTATTTTTNTRESPTPPPPPKTNAPSVPSHIWANRSSSLPDIRVDDSLLSASSPAEASRDTIDLAFQSLPKYRSRSCSSASTTSTSASSSTSSSEEEEKISSVPNDLDRISRVGTHRRRQPSHHHHHHHHHQQHRHSSSSSSSADPSDLSDEYSGDTNNLAAVDTANIDHQHHHQQQHHHRRSRSWTDRRDYNLLKFEATQNKKAERSLTQSLGYMNASYNNLTLLDYSVGGRSKRSRNSLNMELDDASNAVRKSRDCESIVSRGNYLLDEVSQNFDRNASILTDHHDEPNLKQPNPKAPQRHHRKSSHSSCGSSCSDVDETLMNQSTVQHIQLTIRKPPRKNSCGSRKSLVLTMSNSDMKESDAAPSPKTFDQDPTNLRTSYAQSLEKCNFDMTEVSSAADLNNRIPKRRFHSSASSASSAAQQKRTLVASTPNLNAYDPRNGEIEDDIYVSSAHNSMHHLSAGTGPDGKRPLGILLPAGSRASFGKEVSFCPVVSKYSWQEQSSEECQDHHQQSLSADQEIEEDDDDENIDNADATVIINTKENENVAAAANEHDDKQSKGNGNCIKNEEKIQRDINDDNKENTKTSHEEKSERVTIATYASKSISNTPPISIETTIVECVSPIGDSAIRVSSDSASNKNANASVTSVNGSSNKSLQTVNQLTTASNCNITIRELEPHCLTRMSSNYSVKCSSPASGEQASVVVNNNNELMKSKFKADEKHPQHKGFLSRFANGFRFSLRRNKKKHQMQQQQQHQQQQQQQQGSGDSNSTKSESSAINKSATFPSTAKSTKNNSPDFIYIPLKGPLPAGGSRNGGSPCRANVSNDDSGCSSNNSNTSTTTDSRKTHVLITGKPPLPKQAAQPPPRVVAVCEKQQRAGQNSHRKLSTRSSSSCNIGNAANFETGCRAGEIDERFLDNERRYYYYDDFKNQLNGTMNGNGCTAAVAAVAGTVAASPPSFVGQKTQMFNNMINNNNNNNNSGANNSASAYGAKNNNCKIGLIETNLDTHETVISGKTRSLMELGPHYQQQQNAVGGRYNFVKRPQPSGGAGGYHHDVDDNGDLDADGEGHRLLNVRGGGPSMMGGSSGGGTQAGQTVTASVRRPHKSMEFLLDKENQKNVLPPENELQKSHDHNSSALSEHQLRVQASLQRLNIPDWFRQYNQSTPRTPDGSLAYKPGNFTRKRASDSGRWTGLNSKTTSLSSLGSQRSDRSPLLLSPSAHSHHGGQTGGGGGGGVGCSGGGSTGNSVVSGGASHGGGASGNFSRWSTSYLNSTQTSPSVSQRGSFSRGGPVNSSFISVASGTSGIGIGGGVRSSFRQPYLGWRSQEKLSQPRTPHERLASSLLAATHQQKTSATTQKSASSTEQQPVTPEIQSSIKEVTSAIVHYVNDQTNRTNQRSRSTSPNSRKCWLESSFVGTRPLESPQTPVIDNSTFSNSSAVAAAGLHNPLQTSYTSYLTNSSATSSIHSNIAATADVLRMNGVGGESAILI